MYSMDTATQQIPSVSPPNSQGEGFRSRGKDVQNTFALPVPRGNLATLDGFAGNRGASFFNVDYNRAVNAANAIEVSKPRQAVLSPRWPRSIPIDLQKLEGHVAVLPSILQVTAGQIGNFF